MVSTVEGINVGKDLPAFTAFNSINETLDLDEENKAVAKDGAEEPSKDEKFSFLAMESNDQNKRTDTDEDGQTVWSVETDYRNTDNWNESQVGTISEEWDPSPFHMVECE